MAGTATLGPPPANLPQLALSIELLPASALCRVSRHDSNEPFYGRSGGCRFDDRASVQSKRFGTCYLGLTLAVAFAESVLHDVEPTEGRFSIPVTEVLTRFALRFDGGMLRLANMTGAALLRLGGNGELSGTADYRLPQLWARAVVAHPDQVDGMVYMSRRINDQPAIVLFHRPGAVHPAIALAEAVPLPHHRDYTNVIAELGVTIS